MKCRRLKKVNGINHIVWFGSYGTVSTATVTLEEKKVGLYDSNLFRLIDSDGTYLFAKEEE